MRRQHSADRRQVRVLSAACLLMTVLACDKVPTLPELIGDEKPVEGQVPDQALAPVVTPAASGPPPLSQTPAPRPPQQIVDEFLATQPRLRTSGQLEELLKLDAEFLQQITALDLSDSSFNDASVQLIPRFPALTRLDLSGTAVTNDGLTQVARIEGLQELVLNRVAVDGEGLKSLADQQQLRELSLVDTPISDPAFAHLQKMDGLEVLKVSGTRTLQGHGFDELVNGGVMRNLRELEASSTGFGYYGLRNLNKLTALEVLRVADAQISDQTLPGIGQCRNLRELDLRKNPVGDEGLKHVARLQQLESLWLAECGVTDTGLNHLRGLKSLKYVDLSGTLCTPGAVRQLKERHLSGARIRLGSQEF
jgi:Leucine-rich repeat (LRR) protein